MRLPMPASFAWIEPPSEILPRQSALYRFGILDPNRCSGPAPDFALQHSSPILHIDGAVQIATTRLNPEAAVQHVKNSALKSRSPELWIARPGENENSRFGMTGLARAYCEKSANSWFFARRQGSGASL
jgi:putative hemolysin